MSELDFTALDTVIVVQYTCRTCRVVNREVSVKARKEGEELIVWIEGVRTAVYLDHRALSPFCTSVECDLKIPAPEGQPIGTPQRQ